MWTEEEDEELRALVAEYGQKKWAFICTKMSTGKGAKQCRRRWSNYLNNDLKQGGWSPEEDEILWNGHKQHGNKWTEIAKMVGGRTDNAVKNRHAVLVKKEEDRLAGGGASESSGKRKRRDADDRPSHAGGSKASKASKPTKTGSRQTNDQSTGGLPGSAVHFPGTATGPNAAANVAGWRPNLNLSVKIPTSSAEERGESNLPSAMTGGTSAPPSLEGLPTSASLTAAEIELLKQVQELISPHAEGLTLPAGTARRRARRVRAAAAAATAAGHADGGPAAGHELDHERHAARRERAGVAPGARRASPTPRTPPRPLRASTAFCFASF